MIIDAKTQVGPGLASDTPLQPPLRTVTAEELIAVLDRVGIDRAVVHAPRWLGGTAEEDFVDPNYEQANAAIAEGLRRHPDRLIGFARVNPKFGSQAAAELEKCFRAYGFRGLYLDNHTEGFSYADLKLLGPLVEICAARHAPVMLYTWVTPSQPFQLLDLAEAFPAANLILAHSGYRLTDDAAVAAEHASNIIFETSLGNPGIARMSRRFGADRIVFGSNAPFGFPEVELQRVRRWGQLDDAQLELVLGGNIARLVGLAA